MFSYYYPDQQDGQVLQGFGYNPYSPPKQETSQQQGMGVNPMQFMDLGGSAGTDPAGMGPGMFGGESSGGAGGMGGAGLAAIIAAIILGQHELSEATDREYLGHKTGDVFEGNFFTEPWESWGLQQLGVDEPSPGEKTDAFIQTGDYGRAIASLPRTGARWFDPVGDFIYQWGDDQLGDFGGLLDPLRWGLDQLS